MRLVTFRLASGGPPTLGAQLPDGAVLDLAQASGGAAESRDELRVFGDEGTLHLLEQTQLFFGERHDFLPLTMTYHQV